MFETIVISGGAWDAMMVLGALIYVCEKTDLSNVNTFIGTSSGSIVAYLLCIGYDPYEIIEYIINSKIYECFEKTSAQIYFSLWQQSYVYEYEKVVESVLIDMTLKKLNYIPSLSDIYKLTGKTFTCYSFNMNTDESVELSKESFPTLSCLKAIRMSCSIPMFFDKCFYQNEWYIDGGIQENFPVFSVTDSHSTLGFNIIDHVSVESCSTLVGYLYQIFSIPHRKLNELKLKSIHNTCIITIKGVGMKSVGKLTIQEILQWVSVGYSNAANETTRNFIFV